MAELSTMARPYAKAVFELAQQQNTIELWSTALAELTAIVAEDKVAALLGKPSVSAEQKANTLVELLGRDDAGVKNLLLALAENGRLALVANVREQFEALKAELGVEVQAVVTSAFAMTDAQEKALNEKLTARFGRPVVLRSEVDASLIGGVIIRAGDVTLDGSVRGKLAKLAEAMNS
ncbi:F0F1 ATP synthase subunit delta [Salinibius halmophilus]|uniref:F0F1 ATP synthase subunit delta n=1 Tax=Salinibius halmophilus TaxID=1853216 RepID=UPI000E66E0C0|nr:F0F1 ATP synthase subunit delta [Salinibius halmophilus]